LKLLWWFSGIVDQQVKNMAGGLSGLEFCACQKKSKIRFIFDDFSIFLAADKIKGLPVIKQTFNDKYGGG